MSHSTLIQSAAFEQYGRALSTWLDGGASDESDVFRATAEVCRAAHASGARAEHLLTALHAAGAPARGGIARDPERERRYVRAVAHVMESCFGETRPELRITRCADGRDWTVLLVREAQRRVGGVPSLRQDWLFCTTVGERRYITPVPELWEHWTDAEMATAIGKARPDIRGPD